MLINDLLAYSRIGRPDKQFSETDCNSVLQRALDDLKYRVHESRASITNDDLLR
ncbi:MAG: hypothetical protein ACLPN1_02950 [Dissulfurispiraceae bacterium]